MKTALPKPTWRRRLLAALPVPHVLAMPATGVDISDHGIKYLRFATDRDGRKIEAFGELPLPSGAVVGGDAKDAPKLVEALRTLREAGAFGVRVALPESKSYVFQMSVAARAPEDISSIVEFGLEEHVPLKAAESLFDWELLAERGGNADINVTVYPRGGTEDIAAALRAAGLLPLSFEIESQALARAIVPTGDRGTYMTVDFGETRTGLSIASEGSVRFTSSIDVAGSVLTQGIMKHFGVGREEAVRIKNEHGLRSDKAHREFHDLLLSVLSSLRDEINRHYLYWHTHEAGTDGSARIEKIFLVGGNANIRGLADYLSLSMRADVVVPNVWQNAFSLDAYIPPIEARDSLRFATAIGLALRDT